MNLSFDHPLEPPGETEGNNNSNEKVEKLLRYKGSFVVGISQSMVTNYFKFYIYMNSLAACFFSL